MPALEAGGVRYLALPGGAMGYGAQDRVVKRGLSQLLAEQHRRLAE